MKKSIFNAVITYFCILFPSFVNTSVAATVGGVGSLGDFAGNILDPLCIMTNAFYKICYLIGTALLIASAIQYGGYRRNPLQVRLSQPMALLIFGLAFILLPLTVLSVCSLFELKLGEDKVVRSKKLVNIPPVIPVIKATIGRKIANGKPNNE